MFVTFTNTASYAENLSVNKGTECTDRDYMKWKQTNSQRSNGGNMIRCEVQEICRPHGS